MSRKSQDARRGEVTAPGGLRPGSQARQPPAKADRNTPVVSEKKPRAQVRNKIRDLEPQVRRELDDRLRDGNFGGYRKLARWLRERSGKDISPTSLNYYHQHRFERRLHSVSTAIAQAQEIVKLTGGDQNQLALVTATVAQTLLLEMLMAKQELQEAMDAANRARERGDLRIEQRRARKAAEPAPDRESDAQAGSSEAPAHRKYPTKADFEAMHSAARALDAINRFYQSMVNLVQGGKKPAGAPLPIAPGHHQPLRDGGLSPEAEASIRAALLDTSANHPVTKSAQSVEEEVDS